MKKIKRIMKKCLSIFLSALMLLTYAPTQVFAHEFTISAAKLGDELEKADAITFFRPYEVASFEGDLVYYNRTVGTSHLTKFPKDPSILIKHGEGYYQYFFDLYGYVPSNTNSSIPSGCVVSPEGSVYRDAYETNQSIRVFSNEIAEKGNVKIGKNDIIVSNDVYKRFLHGDQEAQQLLFQEILEYNNGYLQEVFAKVEKKLKFADNPNFVRSWEIFGREKGVFNAVRDELERCLWRLEDDFGRAKYRTITGGVKILEDATPEAFIQGMQDILRNNGAYVKLESANNLPRLIAIVRAGDFKTPKEKADFINNIKGKLNKEQERYLIEEFPDVAEQLFGKKAVTAGKSGLGKTVKTVGSEVIKGTIVTAAFAAIIALAIVDFDAKAGNSFEQAVDFIALESRVENGEANDVEKYVFYTNSSSASYIKEHFPEFEEYASSVIKGVKEVYSGELANNELLQIPDWNPDEQSVNNRVDKKIATKLG